ncbi:MAG: HlyD family secretion protein, partial [Epsilonproteobacteria bacterium]|nr:HlyD family secretion protein [Campylobacterota bacterium]
AKVEPYEIRDISSNVSGVVVYANENMIGKKLTNKAYLKIDSELDREELLFLKNKLSHLNKILVVNVNVLKNLKKTLLKKRKNYKKIEGLKFKSTVEKDRSFYDLMSSENLSLATQKEIENLKLQILDLKLRKTKLKKSIKDKYLSDKGFVLYSLLVKVGQVVNISTPLAKIADISKAKLTIYLDADDMIDVEKKIVYINHKKTTYKISRILRIADGKNISKYMAQIIVKSPKLFSKLTLVELKDK